MQERSSLIDGAVLCAHCESILRLGVGSCPRYTARGVNSHSDRLDGYLLVLFKADIDRTSASVPDWSEMPHSGPLVYESHRTSGAGRSLPTDARALSVHTRRLFYEPRRSSGASRSLCLQGIDLVCLIHRPLGGDSDPLKPVLLGKPIFSGRYPGSAGGAHAMQ